MIMMMNIGTIFENWITPDKFALIIRVGLMLILGIPMIRLLRSLTKRLVRDKLSAQGELLVIRTVYYASMLILFMTILNEFGFKLSALLGAAGIFGIALGFASQTSVSNIISGIFLISEKPFVIGDTVQIGGTAGEVQSIDLLSIKLRTADNRFVRVPNETMIKSEVINITKYPIRRLEIPLLISPGNDLAKVSSILLAIANKLDLTLSEPEPSVIIDSFTDLGTKLIFYVWGNKENIILLKSSLMQNIVNEFDKEHISMSQTRLKLVGTGTET